MIPLRFVCLLCGHVHTRRVRFCARCHGSYIDNRSVNQPIVTVNGNPA